MVKFDIRYMLMLRSVQPLRLYAYNVFWLRFANRCILHILSYLSRLHMPSINCSHALRFFTGTSTNNILATTSYLATIWTVLWKIMTLGSINLGDFSDALNTRLLSAVQNIPNNPFTNLLLLYSALCITYSVHVYVRSWRLQRTCFSYYGPDLYFQLNCHSFSRTSWFGSLLLSGSSWLSLK